MSHYLVDIDLPESFDEDFTSMIPEQRAHIDTLMQNGVVTSYSLALDKSKLWTTVLAKDQEELRDILSEFPLINYFVLSIHELAFHNTTAYRMPPISLN